MHRPEAAYAAAQQQIVAEVQQALVSWQAAVRVYNETAEQCIAARSGLSAAAAELVRAVGL